MNFVRFIRRFSGTSHGPRRQRNRARLSIEPRESRFTPSATFNTGHLVVTSALFSTNRRLP